MIFLTLALICTKELKFWRLTAENAPSGRARLEFITESNVLSEFAAFVSLDFKLKFSIDFNKLPLLTCSSCLPLEPCARFHAPGGSEKELFSTTDSVHFAALPLALNFQVRTFQLEPSNLAASCF